MFKKHFDKLSKELIGKTIVVGQRRATIMGTEAHPGTPDEKGLWAPMAKLNPGDTYCARQRGAFLFVLACGGDPGGYGRILIRELEINGAFYDRPGQVSQALGIQTHGATGRLRERGGELVLEMDGLEAPSVAPRGKAAQARKMSEGLLKRHMPKIVETWKHTSQGKPFLDFVNELITHCPDEPTLRDALRT